jgi:hypothetical protein
MSYFSAISGMSVEHIAVELSRHSEQSISQDLYSENLSPSHCYVQEDSSTSFLEKCSTCDFGITL